MTESEWLACESPRDLAAFARGRVDAARFRWLAVEWGMRIRHFLFEPSEVAWFDAYAAWVGGAGPHPDELGLSRVEYLPLVNGPDPSTLALYFLEWLQAVGPLNALDYAAESAAYQGLGFVPPAPDRSKSHRGRSAAKREAQQKLAEAAQASYRAARAQVASWIGRVYAEQFRDVAGNPFRPAVLDAAWLSPDVLGLARAAFATADFSLLPILADALEEAGCDSADVLGHLRGVGVHVRGCWALEWARAPGDSA